MFKEVDYCECKGIGEDAKFDGLHRSLETVHDARVTPAYFRRIRGITLRDHTSDHT